MEYLRPYQLPFQHKDWLKSLLFMAICVLIPIIGIMVLFGYRAQLMDRWLKDDGDERQRAFDFGRFGEYLQRGVWPFIYQLIIGFAIGMIAALVYAGFFFVAILAKEPVIIFVAYVLYMISVLFLQVIIKFIVWPFVLHGQITAKFEFGEAFRFAKDFYSRIGITNLAGIAFCATLLDALVVLAGLVVCCVGVYAAAAVAVLADNHFLWQLYRKYLAKGGQQIEPNEPTEPPPSPGKNDEYPDDGI